MGYLPMDQIAAGIVERIAATGKFKKVLYAQATNGEQLWEMLEGLANVPCAIVAIGTVDYDDGALKRTIRPLVFIIGKFNKGLANDAAGIWQLAASVSDCFTPAATPEGMDYPEVCGIEFVAISWTPISSPANISAYCLSLEGPEFLTKE